MSTSKPVTPNEVNPLNMAEKAFLEANKNETLEKLSEALNRPKNFIDFELRLLEQRQFEQESAPQPDASKKIEETPSVTTVKKESPLLNSFVRRKEGGVCAMSGAAAQLSDEVIKGSEKKSIFETRPDCITRVRK